MSVEDTITRKGQKFDILRRKNGTFARRIWKKKRKIKRKED